MITPTLRAISPQDIVRIYVPPAPPNEQKHYQDLMKMKIPQSTKDSEPNNLYEGNNIQKHLNNNKKIKGSNETVNTITEKSLHSSQTTLWPPKNLSELGSDSNTNSIIYGSGDLTPVHCSSNKSDDDLTKHFTDSSPNTNSNNFGYVGISGVASSSSRRGSLSRKSPSAMFDSNILMECSHMIKQRLSSQSNSSINFENRDKNQSLSNENDSASNKRSSLSLRLNSNGNSQNRMTSFEQLAASKYKNQSNEKLNDNNDKYSPDDEENYSYSYYKYKSTESRQRQSPTTVENNRRFGSENNVQYESNPIRKLSTENNAQKKRRPNSSSNETSLFQYESYSVAASQKTTSIKEYKRFYGTSNEDTCDDELKKSSDESSSSPNSKSVLNSPDTIPLLQSSPPSYIPVAKLKSPVSPTYVGYDSTVESPIKPSRIPVMHVNERKTSSICSPSGHMYPNSSDLNRVLPPIEVVNSTSNNSVIKKKMQITSISPNGQPITFSTNRPMKLQSKNGTTMTDSNTIRIKVNQNDKQ